MKIKPLILATALALTGFTATSSYAANYVVDLGAPSSIGGYSAGFGATVNAAGAFFDTFTFTPDIHALAKGSLISTNFNSHDVIQFTSATLNDIPFIFGNVGTDVRYGYTSLIPIVGPVILKVWGIASPMLLAGTAVSASYGGTMTVGAVSAVPEPETYAMMLAGLGLMGFMARRRKKTESKEKLPQLSVC